MSVFTRIVLGIFVASCSGGVVALLSGASWWRWVSSPALILSGWAALGHLVTLDDDAPGGWSSPPNSAESKAFWRSSLAKLALKALVFGGLVCPFFVGCGLTPESVSKDDGRLKPLWAAIDRVDRKTLGFTEIAPNARISLEGKQLLGNDYDAMLHIYAETSRTIAFRKVGEGYEWIGEQEIHEGPKDYTTVDGTFKEHVSITYEIEHVSGAPLKTVYVQYFGKDPRLAHKPDLSLADVAKVLQEWRQTR